MRSLREEAEARGVSVWQVRKERGEVAHQDLRDQLTLRVDPALADRLRAAAAERDVAVNWLLTRAVEDFLDRLIPAEELRLTRSNGVA